MTTVAEHLKLFTEHEEAKKKLNERNGKIEHLSKNFKLTAEAAAELAEYWQRVKIIIDRCGIEAEDNIQTAICKAYISASGRETAAFKSLREHGISIYNHDGSNYFRYFLPTIFPADEKEAAEAAEAVKDAELLEVARAIGKMRNP